MDSNRTILIAILIAAFLAGVTYLATLRPLVDTGGTLDTATNASSETNTDTNPAPAQAAQPTAAQPTAPAPNATAETTDDKSNQRAEESPAVAETESDVIFYSYNVLNSYPHDYDAFTQGLIWHEGQLYEGTGLRGRSSLRKVNLEDGDVSQQIALPDELFGEGITIFANKIYQLTWQANVGFVYDLESFEELTSFTYPTEGWGITHDGQQLIMSDGSTRLYFWDPETLEEIRNVEVTLRGEPVNRLNELEYIDGMVYANIWQTNFIAIIDPESGIIRGMINLEGLLQIPAGHTSPVDVLNGIAYDDENDRLFVTGKLWPQLYEIKLIEDPSVQEQ